MDMQEMNDKIIAEFRANDGKVGGQFEGAPLVLVHHTGAKSGTERVTPMMYRPERDGFAIFASKAGAPNNPAWFHNLVANPDTQVEVGTETLDVTARVTEGAERDHIWEAQKTEYPGFADYENATDRVIPVLVLERRG